jgi:hypothetical protein
VVFTIVSILVIPALAQVDLNLTDVGRKRFEKFKQRAGFDNWPGKHGVLKAGFALKKELLSPEWHRWDISPWWTEIIVQQKWTMSGCSLSDGKGRVDIRVHTGSGSIKTIQESMLLDRREWARVAFVDELRPKAPGPGDVYIGGPPHSYVWFARNNIAVRVKREGGISFSSEAVMELAHEIDNLILKQPQARQTDFPILELKNPSKIYLAKGEKATILLRRSDKDNPVTVKKTPWNSKAVLLWRSGITEEGLDVRIPVEGREAGKVTIHVGTYDKKTLLCQVKVVTVIVDGEGVQEPETTKEEENQPGIHDRTLLQETKRGQQNIIELEPEPQIEPTDWFGSSLIAAAIVLTGVVIFLLLRRKSSLR